MENIWHLRKVADTAAKSCFICYKPSSHVLITPDNKDFFYICIGHTRDRQFAVPTDDEAKAIAERKKKEELDAEIEKVKKEYEEKQKNKKKKKDKSTEGEDKKDKDKDATTNDKDEKERDDKIKALTEKSAVAETTKAEDGPRIFQLQKHFYQARLEKLRTAEQAKRNRERLRNPSTFPSVPSGFP